MKKMKLPNYIILIISKLEESGFEGFAVGGCARDLLLGREPKDWDIATNAKPKEIQKIFPDSIYENDFGTVGIKIPNEDCHAELVSASQKSNDEILKPAYRPGRQVQDDRLIQNCTVTIIVEITTYRIESKYSDKRHPDKIRFAKTLEEDLGRRDFTINSMAIRKTRNAKHKASEKKEEHYELHVKSYEIIDPFGGREDLKNKLIRAVGDASERFNEDALRMMRAIRFASTLNGISKPHPSLLLGKEKEKILWKIEKNTFEAIKKNAKNLNYISKERTRDELVKIILSEKPAEGLELLHEAGLLEYIIFELETGYGVTQSHHHYYGPYNTVYKHCIASLSKCPSKKLEVRLAALLHDVGKPETKRGEGENATFYNHEYAGAKIAKKILERLKFSRAIIEKVVLLIRNHMFYYNVSEVGEAGVRKVIRKVGLENIEELIDVRISDRLGSGVPKAVPYKLRHFKFMVEKVSRDAVSVAQLKINGNDLIKKIKLDPGPKIGAILDVLLARVIDDSKLNSKKNLLDIAEELSKKDLKSLRLIAKKKIEAEKKEEERLMKKKYWVE